MEKKTFYVVTETIVNLEKKSVDTFVKGISEELDNAHSILASSKSGLIICGFDKSLISDFTWGWTYESETCIVKDEIYMKLV